MPAMVDNWIRLGLVTVEYDKSLTNDTAYAWIESRPEYTRQGEVLDSEKEQLEYNKGILRRTSFGKQLGYAVGIVEKNET